MRHRPLLRCRLHGPDCVPRRPLRQQRDRVQQQLQGRLQRWQVRCCVWYLGSDRFLGTGSRGPGTCRYGGSGETSADCSKECPAGYVAALCRVSPHPSSHGALTRACVAPRAGTTARPDRAATRRNAVPVATATSCKVRLVEPLVRPFASVRSSASPSRDCSAHGVVSASSSCTGPCNAGRYGGAGQTSASCSGACAEGYYCGSGSSSSTQYACGSDQYYCTGGSRYEVPTQYYSTGVSGRRTGKALCPIGYYCNRGRKHACPAGRFGSTTGLGTADCSGPCTAGEEGRWLRSVVWDEGLTGRCAWCSRLLLPRRLDNCNAVAVWRHHLRRQSTQYLLPGRNVVSLHHRQRVPRRCRGIAPWQRYGRHDGREWPPR